MNGTPQLPRRNDYTPPAWWLSYTAEFPQWRAWEGVQQFWARLPGTMRVCQADDPAELASRIRAATSATQQIARTPDNLE